MKKNRLFINRLFVFIVSALFLSSCSKDENVKVDQSTDKSSILSFESVTDYNEALNKVLSMNPQQLRAYEESNGYKSFGRSCDEVYNSINPENFKSVEEVKAHVAKNSKFLKLVQDENGELTLETALMGSINRYFVNEDRMFQISKNVYKVFDEGVASTSAENIELLKAIADKNVIAEQYGAKIRFMPVSKEISDTRLKDAAYNCGTGSTARATNGNNRTLLEISMGYLDTYDINNIPMTIFQSRVLIRPYKKTLGIWYWCTRTLSCDIKIAVDYNTTAGWQRGYYYKTESNRSDSKLEYIIEGGVISIGYWSRLDMHFGGYNSWADSPSTDPARLICNANLF